MIKARNPNRRGRAALPLIAAAACLVSSIAVTTPADAAPWPDGIYAWHQDFNHIDLYYSPGPGVGFECPVATAHGVAYGTPYAEINAYNVNTIPTTCIQGTASALWIDSGGYHSSGYAGSTHNEWSVAWGLTGGASVGGGFTSTSWNYNYYVWVTSWLVA